MRSFTHLMLAASAAAQILQPRYVLRSGDIVDHPLPTLSKRKAFAPCAEVSELWAAQVAQLSKPGAAQLGIRVPAQRAYECLMSVPVDVDGDLQEIDELKAFLQYQSTLAWLKSGVKDVAEPHDVMKLLDSLAVTVKGKKTFKSDYEVQLSLRRILDAAGDFHLQYMPDITNVFQFARPAGQLVSISEDGVSLPKLYVASDLPKDANGKITGSAVVKINGDNATTVLEKYSDGTNYHDADARFNTVFPNPPLTALGTDSGGLSLTHYIYPGPTTNFTFANGTQKVIDNVAFIAPNFDFTHVSDGPSFFEAFCTGPLQPTVDPPAAAASSSKPSTSSKASPSSKPSSVASATPRPSPSLLGYPKPIFIHGSKLLSGYEIGGNDYKDTAVLVAPGFLISSIDPTYAKDPVTRGFVEAQALLRQFLADAVKQNKKKLVIDLRGNGGGLIDFAFEMFKQLFPTVEPYGGARYRAHEAFHYYSALVADVALEGGERDGKISDAWDDADYGVQSNFLWSNVLDENMKPFKSYKDYYGPDTINGDTFTSIRRYNFSDNIGGHTLNASLTGYNELKNVPVQPFQADNIVLLEDGFCGSACAIFAELMREQGKVQTIVVGGRPRNEPMQGVGGSKGSQLLPFDALAEAAKRTIEIAAVLDGAAIAKQLNATNVGNINNAQQIYVRTAVPEAGRSLVGGVNGLNNQRQNDTTQTPLEFIYEAADCRLFYTTASFLDPVNLWKMVVDAKWGKGKCVPGSTGHKSAIGTLENRPGFGSKGVNSQQSNADGSPLSTTGAAPSISASGVLMALAGAVAMAIAL